MEPRRGIEPPTNDLRNRCSTIEPPRHNKKRVKGIECVARRQAQGPGVGFSPHIPST